MTHSKPAVVVVGAGPAGAMAALQLARAGLNVQIISHPRQARRVFAEILSPEGRRILAHAGLWGRVPSGVAVPCPAVISAWGRHDAICHSFIINPYGAAWHIDRMQFDNWLLSEAVVAGARVLSGTLIAARRISSQWVFNVRQPDDGLYSGDANFLVVATGQGGYSKLGVRERIDSLCLIGGLSEPNTNGRSELVVEAVPDGWWYSAPVIGRRMFAGLITDAKTIAGKRYPEAMKLALAQAPLTAARLANLPKACCVGVVSSTLRPCAGEGWIAIGDAALARDPLSGEGLACALGSAQEGAGTILRALQGDPFAWQAASERGAAALARYKQRRVSAYKTAHDRWPAGPFWARRLNWI